jgi:pyruvate formate-lyase activating enzyme-like uncharacterized protein
MIIDVNEATLPSIQNSALRSYAEQYVRDYQYFMEQIRTLVIDVDEASHERLASERIAALGKKGAVVRNEGKSVYVNRISPACEACQTSVGSLTFSVSLKCHRNCFFCFYPNQKDNEYQHEHTHDTATELDGLRASGQRYQHLALTGGEPLLHKEETVRFFQHARLNYPNAYTRLYTCGDHLERETLQALKGAGLNEIRISIRLEDPERARRHTFDQITLSREYIPNVMVEMPVLPGALDEMKAVLIELDRLGAFGINLLEFCFPFHNVDEYRARGYRIKARPFRVLYEYTYAGGVPVTGSEATCLDLIEFTLEAGLKLGVHYCSLENKQTSDVYRQNTSGGGLKVLYFSPRDYFLKSAKIFGENVAAARKIFDGNGYHSYRINDEYQFLEFHVSKIKLLKKLNMEVGISANILEKRDGKTYVRELKVDVTTPKTFRLSDV